jgi:hypothetical protein
MECGGTDALLALLRDATAARATAAGRDAAAADTADADSGAANGGGRGTRDATAELARGAAGALRQLANSDAVKSQLAELGALESIVRCKWAGGVPR